MDSAENAPKKKKEAAFENDEDAERMEMMRIENGANQIENEANQIENGANQIENGDIQSQDEENIE